MADNFLLPSSIVDDFPDEIYNRSPNSRYKSMMDAVMEPSNKCWMRFLQTYADQFLKSCCYDALDYNFGAVFGIPRLPREKYSWDPYTQELEQVQWQTILNRDDSYRKRIQMFIKAINTGGMEGLRMGIEAATGITGEIWEQYHYGPHIKDLTGEYMFTVVPQLPNWGAGDSYAIKSIIDRLKPADSVYVIANGVERLQDVAITGISGSDCYAVVDEAKAIFENSMEWDSDNYVSAVAPPPSSEYIKTVLIPAVEDYRIHRENIMSIDSSGSPNVQRNIAFSGSSVDCWYRYNYELYGHKGSDAFGGDTSTYWLSVGNAQGDQVYAYEWIQAEMLDSGEGSGFNTVRFHVPYLQAHMSMWLCVMDNNLAWNNIGGTVIPYDPTHYAVYPNTSDIEYAFYCNDISALIESDDGNGYWCKWNVGTWFANTKYIRLVFHNLPDTGIGTYHCRAAVSEMQVWADLTGYYTDQRLMDVSNNIPWISQPVYDGSIPGQVWLKINFFSKVWVNMIRIVLGSRASGQVFDVYNDAGTKLTTITAIQKEGIYSFNATQTSYLRLVWTWCPQMSLLSNWPGAEIMQVDVSHREVTITESSTKPDIPNPASNITDNKYGKWWCSAYRSSASGQVEWVEMSLADPDTGETHVDINRIEVWSVDKGLSLIARTWDGSQWRTQGREDSCDTSTIFSFDLVNTDRIRIEIPVLAKQSNGYFAARIREVSAWARLESNQTPAISGEIDMFTYEVGYAIDGDPDTCWMSAPVAKNNTPKGPAVAYLTLETSGEEAAHGLYIDPILEGYILKVYYCKENELVESKRIWRPVTIEDYLEKGVIWFPNPVRGYFFKLEFYNLQPRPYEYKITTTTYTTVRVLSDQDRAMEWTDRNVSFPKSHLHDYDPDVQTIPIRMVGLFAGVKELRLLTQIGLGKDIHELEETFADNTAIALSAGEVYYDETNETLCCSGGAMVIFDNITLGASGNLASDLQSVCVNIDEYVPSGGNALWWVSRNGGTDWHDISDFTGENHWFNFAEDDAAPWDDFVMLLWYLPSPVPGTGVYTLNGYTVQFHYYKLL